MEIVLAVLLFLHVLGDFYIAVYKGKKDNQDKKAIDWKRILVNVGLYSIPFSVFAIIDIVADLVMVEWWQWLIIVFANAALHLIVDSVACAVMNKNEDKKGAKVLTFVFRFLADFVFLFGIYHLMVYPFGISNSGFLSSYARYIKIITVLMIIIRPVAMAVDYLFADAFGGENKKPAAAPAKKSNKEVAAEDNADAAAEKPAPAPKKENSGLDISKIIGMLERVVYFLLMIFGAYTGIVLVLAIKVAIRFNDLKDETFRNKFILGTLMSLCTTMLIALFVM